MMKLFSLTIAFILAFSLGSIAQDWSTDVYKYGEQYPGYIIDADGNKTEGYIKYQNRYKMQNEVLFFKEKGNKKSKQKLKTADLQEYKVADKVYHCIHFSGGLMSKPVRANLVVNEGCITEYVWYTRAENYMTMQQGANESDEEFYARMYPPKTVFKKKGEEEVRSSDYFAVKFAKKMSEYVSDNAELSAKVANKEKGYRILRILDIIAQYNANCTE